MAISDIRRIDSDRLVMIGNAPQFGVEQKSVDSTYSEPP